MVVTGVLSHVIQQLRKANWSWRCCNGPVPTTVTGILTHAVQQLEEATWRCCSGHVPMAVTGILTHAMQQLMEATWRCCSGRVTTAAPNHDNILILIMLKFEMIHTLFGHRSAP